MKVETNSAISLSGNDVIIQPEECMKQTFETYLRLRKIACVLRNGCSLTFNRICIQDRLSQGIIQLHS